MDRLLLLSGSPEQIGQQYGHRAGHLIQRATEEYLSRSIEIFGVPTATLLDEAKRFEEFIPLNQLVEMQSLARASNVRYEEILAINALIDIDAGYFSGLLHCCNFAAFDRATADGRLYHGRNLDFPHGGVIPDLSLTIVRVPEMPGVLPTISVTWAGFVGTLTGYNRERLSAAEVSAISPHDRMEGVPIACLLRDALEKSTSVSELSGVFRSHVRTGGYNVLVCDGKTTECRAVECTAISVSERGPEKDLIIVDNPCLCAADESKRLVHAAGVARYIRARQLLEAETGSIDLDTAKAVLRDELDLMTGSTQGKNYNSICNHHTVQSVIFDHESQSIFISDKTVPAPMDEYVEIRPAELFEMARSQDSLMNLSAPRK